MLTLTGSGLYHLVYKQILVGPHRSIVIEIEHFYSIMVQRLGITCSFGS